jgi:hypothetical protein
MWILKREKTDVSRVAAASSKSPQQGAAISGVQACSAALESVIAASRQAGPGNIPGRSS